MTAPSAQDLRKGLVWREAERSRDAVTNREVIRLTSAGEFNNTPTYHTNTAFTADGKRLVFVTVRGGRRAVCVAKVASGELTCLTEPTDQELYGSVCLAPRSRWCVYRVGREVRAVHLDTLKERSLWAGEAGWRSGMPSVAPDEKTVILPVSPEAPAALANERDPRVIHRHWTENGGMCARLMAIPLDGSGAAREVYREAGVACNHVQYCPLDPDLVVIDRDFPPAFAWGSDGQTNRTWALRLSTRQLTELAPRCRKPFQVHGTWAFEDDLYLMHGWWGRSNHDGWYFCALRPDGEVEREYVFPGAEHYGHVSAATDRMGFILDGNLTGDLLLWLHYGTEEVRFEAIARHATEWGSVSGQLSHPHPLGSPCMRWVSYNAARGGRTDVYVVRVGGK